MSNDATVEPPLEDQPPSASIAHLQAIVFVICRVVAKRVAHRA
jgi:hypothetical protein